MLMDAPNEIYSMGAQQRKSGNDTDEITVPAELYEKAYLQMHDFYLYTPGEVVHVVDGKIVPAVGPFYPLPVPDGGYELWGFMVKKQC